MNDNTELLNISEEINEISNLLDTKLEKSASVQTLEEVHVNNLTVGTHGNIVEALNLVSQSVHGRMSKEDKKKLDGIEEGSNKYIHPTTHPASMIVEDSTHKFVTDAQIAAWNAKANRAGDTFTGNVIISTANPTMLNLYRTGPNLNNSIKFSLKDGTINKYIGLYDQEFRIGDNEDLRSGGRIWHSRNSYVVPTPETANNARFLRNDNTWQTVTPGNIGAYTKSETYNRTEIDNKFNQMNSGMDWKESVATYNDLATTYPNPQDGWTVNVKDTDYTYRWSGSAWIAISANAIPLASSNVDGKMSKADKAKLDSISSGANAYVHPSTHPATMIVEDSTHKFVTDAQIAAWNAKVNTSGTYTGLNVGSAAKWTTARTLSLTGDVSGSVSMDGSGNVSMTTSVANNSHTHLWANITDKPSTFPPSSHGNHVPTVETANNTRFLRNDNSWQTVTPGNIGAYTKAEVDAGWTAGTRDNWYLKNTLAVTGDVNVSFKYGKTGFFCGSSLTNQMPWGTHTWKHYITMSHANSAGYTGMIGMNFNGDEIGFKAISDGADKGWRRIWHHGNFDPNSKANTAHDHPNLSRFRGVAGWGASGFNVAASFESSGHVGIELRTTNANTFGFGGHQDGNLRWWYGAQTGDTSAGKRYIMTLNANGDLRPNRLFNAVWNDYAELFPKLKSTITEAGDIIALDISNDKEVYTKATEETSSFIVGVHSDEYAHLIGGERPADDYSGTFEEFNKDKFIPVGLAGRVKAKCIGIIKKGDKLVISDIPGVARAFNPKLDNINNVFGMAVENKNNPDVISRVRMFIKN